MPKAGKVLDVSKVLITDEIGKKIACLWQEWDMLRAEKKASWEELRRYIYATDTTKTSNHALPWKNTTVTPKLTQIRDNLYANYMASMFPNPRWLEWVGASQDDETKDKVDAIKSYMTYVINHPEFKNTISQAVLDYIDYGNAIVMPDWMDERSEDGNSLKTGYVGPVARRISPLDIVFNPVAPSFVESPKIVRSLVTLGDVKEMLQRFSTNDGDAQASQKLWEYLRGVREQITQYGGDVSVADAYLSVDGFSSFRQYLESDYAEVLTFYGDYYDRDKDEFYKNYIIQVVDRHKVIRQEPNPSYFGSPPMYHSGWRPRQDNLWAMGPLDNLVGLQYRVDHIENLKADLFDLTAFPPIKIKGYVEDFNWGPFEKIVTSEEGDVDILKVDTNPLQANFELDALQNKMEEMAGAPKEAMGFRTPGEKTAYEVQRLENAASRIFQAKISQFEEQILEPLLNSMLELARRRMTDTVVRVIDDEFKVASFSEIAPEDIAGNGRIRPVAARHFIETADRVQTINNFYASGVGTDELVRVHFSGLKLAQLMEELLELQDFKLVTPYIRITEQAEAQQMAQAHDEQNQMAQQTASGMGNDYDMINGPSGPADSVPQGV